MSIKEFIRQTAENQPDNIRDIRVKIERQDEGALFDPERDIFESDWQAVKEVIDRKMNYMEGFPEAEEYVQERENLFAEIIKMRAAMTITSSKKVAELNIKGQPMEIIEKVITHIREKDWGPGTILLWLGRMKIIGGEEAYKFIFTEEEWEKIVRRFEFRFRHKEWISFLYDATEIKIVCPENQELNQHLKNADAILEGVGKHVKGWRGRKDWLPVARLTQMLRILFPQKKITELGVDKSAWCGMHKTLESLRQNGDWENFIELAAAMKILAAERVEVTENGLEITMPQKKEDFRETREPRPVRLRI